MNSRENPPPFAGLSSDALRVLRRVPGWDIRDVEVVARLTGFTNRSYRVRFRGGDYVLRLADPESARLLGLDRSSEHEALAAASALGFAPQLVTFLVPDGHSVTQWVEAPFVAEGFLGDPLQRGVFLDTLRALHRSCTLKAEYDPVRAIVHMADRVAEIHPDGTQEYREPLALARRLALFPATHRSFCHNDLCRRNILAGARPVFVDWEVAGMNDALFDLAALVDYCGEGGDAPGELLGGYFGCDPDSGDLRECFNRARFLHLLRESLWLRILSVRTDGYRESLRDLAPQHDLRGRLSHLAAENLEAARRLATGF